MNTAKTATTAAKAPARRGRKPAAKDDGDDTDLSDVENEFGVDEEPEEEAPVVETGVAAPAEKVKPLRMKLSKAKERALMKEFGLDEVALSEEEVSTRRQRLKELIKLGKTRGYLTNAEISDHLPDKLVDAETLEVVISMMTDMGISVYEQTPDADTLLLNSSNTATTSEEEAEEEAEAALSNVDNEFGRTTDPVRMYMREMGTVELLTREGEIEIAKRIEGGMMDMMEAISGSPATIDEILAMAEEIREDKVVITTVVDGFADADENDDYVAEEDEDEVDDDDDGGTKSQTKMMEMVKNEALRRFDDIRSSFNTMLAAYEKGGYGSPAYVQAQKEISSKLMTIRFTAKTIEKLCDTVRDELDKNLSGLKTPDSTSTAPGIDEGLSTTTPQEDETTWEWPTEPAANSVSNVPKAASSASRSASSASSAPQAGFGSVREPSALQGASSPASSSAAPASTQPVSGRVLNGYSGDELVYNKTLGDWRTHNGIDYACAKDAAVQSPTAGTVVLAGSDGSWGPTVAIKDSAGRVWRLCGVASPAVKEGETVSAGQTLGKVGSVSCECAEESHIHLEVKQDDSYLDPAKLMQ